MFSRNVIYSPAKGSLNLMSSYYLSLAYNEELLPILQSKLWEEPKVEEDLKCRRRKDIPRDFVMFC